MFRPVRRRRIWRLQTDPLTGIARLARGHARRIVSEACCQCFPVGDDLSAGRDVLLFPGPQQFETGVVDVREPFEFHVQFTAGRNTSSPRSARSTTWNPTVRIASETVGIFPTVGERDKASAR